MTETNPNKPKTFTLLEAATPLSRSMLWKLQENFFRQKGAAAWDQGIVPTYITSNPFTAGAYARVVAGYLGDLVQTEALALNQPVYIIELGAGSGCFAYRFLKRFLDIHQHAIFKDVPVKYIATDFFQGNLEFISNHFKMKDFIDDGYLDTACFDARKPAPLKLMHGGETLDTRTLTNPVVLLANYFFDSIPQDVFYVSENNISEVLYTLRTADPTPDIDDPGLLPHIKKTTELRPVHAAHYYGDPNLDTLLESYRQELDDTVLQFPCGALTCLEYFRRLSTDRLLLLSGDKGYVHKESLEHRDLPSFQMHGSFSLTVNYHAAGRYVERAGGRTLHTSYNHSGLTVCAFLLGGPPDQWLETRRAYMDAIEHHGPDDFFRVKKGLEKEFQHWTLEQLTGLLRFSGWDSNIFTRCWPVLLKCAEKASASEKETLRRIADEVWDMHYPGDGKRDPAFCIAELLAALELDEDALDFFRLSLRYCGPKAETLCQMGHCYYRLGEKEPAMECMRKARELDPGMTEYNRIHRFQDQTAFAGREESGTAIPGPVEQEGIVLQHELDWFRDVLGTRVRQYFQEEEEAAGPLHLPPPELGNPDCAYTKLVTQHRLGPQERLVVMLAFAPDIKPELLDVFFTQNTETDRGFSEFGGILGQRHSGFIPTIETAYFLLSGGNLSLRLHYAHFFAAGHTFRRFNILDLDDAGHPEPFAGTPLRLSREILDMLLMGEEEKNKRN